MTDSLIIAAIWLVAANVLALIPSKDNLWARAYFLIATGMPLIIWVFVQNGWIIGVLFVWAASSVLRWPLIYLMRWLRGGGRGDV